MKRALLVVSVMTLSGCSDVSYFFNSRNLNDAFYWKRAEVSYGDAKKYQSSGIDYDTYLRYSIVGATTPEEMKKINDVFPDDGMDIDDFKRSLRAAGLKKIVIGLKNHMFTMDEVSAFLKKAEERAALGPAQQSVMGMGPKTALEYPRILTSSVRNIHYGQTVEDAVDSAIRACKDTKEGQIQPDVYLTH